MSQSRTIRRRLAARLRHADPETLNTAAKWKSVLARTDDAEYVQQLEAENIRLEKDNAVLKDQITPKLLELPELHAARLATLDLERKLYAIERVRADFEELPTDLPGVIELIVRFYPDRIVFTPAAIKSAAVARLNEVSSGVGAAWRVLRAMALTLHDLYMMGDTDMARSFQDRSGFELAHGEGRATKQDAELMRARVVEHEGAFIDVGAHVKYGHREPRLLRVHYAFCIDCARIVVGHCGDHLTTAGTRRLT
jgi:hypothetical protein